MMIFSLIKKCAFVIATIFIFFSISSYAETFTVKNECRENVDTLASYNIVLADVPEHIPLVKEWIANPYSGYPALLTKICSIMENRRLIGRESPVSLTAINHKNLALHQHPDNYPIVNEDQIDSDKLKQAIFNAWSEKNLGRLSTLPPNPTFENILERSETQH